MRFPTKLASLLGSVALSGSALLACGEAMTSSSEMANGGPEGRNPSYSSSDAGVAPPKVDASAPAVKDAAAPPPVVDAAVPPPPPATGPEVPAVGGKCPATYVLLSKDGKCHKDCTSGSAVCGASRCTKNCNVGPPICLSNAALCAPPK